MALLPLPLPFAELEVGHHLYWQIGDLYLHGQVFLSSWILIGILLVLVLAGTRNMQREETGMAPLRWSKLHCQGDEISLFDCSFSDDMRKMWQEHREFALFNDQFSPYEDRYGRDCKSHETIGIYCF